MNYRCGAHTRGMAGATRPAVPVWVVPSALELDDLYAVARSEYDAPRGNRPQATGIVGALLWVTGDALVGPVTGRPDQPVTAAVAKAECWAARAAGDGSRTPEWRLKATCGELGVAYWPPNLELIDPEESYGVYQTLSWLLRWLDGYRGGCVSPLPLPQRNLDASTTTADELDEEVMATQSPLWYLPQQRSMSREWAQAEARAPEIGGRDRGDEAP
jgi:hypothetical protein